MTPVDRLNEAARYIAIAANGYMVDDGGRQHYVTVSQMKRYADQALGIVCDVILELEG